MAPNESEVMCDPASGSGGFLIRYFEQIRRNIEAHVHELKQKARSEIEHIGGSEDQQASAIDRTFARLNVTLDVSVPGSRLWTVAHNLIFGCDAEPRAARTSKMNMIMHGDGHGGIHHHDGLVDVNGIFPGRFDIVLTNPPFGATVEDDQIVGATTETCVTAVEDNHARYLKLFGAGYKQSHARMLKAEENEETVLSLFKISKDAKSAKTEVLFVERCLQLLKPGGRLGIVVPDGVLNNPSLIELRQQVEDEAQIIAVISVPDKTFKSTKTNVKASLLVVRKYTASQRAARSKLLAQVEKSELKMSASRRSLLEGALRISWKQHAKSMQKELENPGSISEEALAIYGVECSEDDFKLKRQAVREEYRRLLAAPGAVARMAVKKKFGYSIFMAVADHVGIRASGKEDPQNELPQILQAWRRYLAKPHELSSDVSQRVFRVEWSEIDRWDPSSFKPIQWHSDPSILKPLGSGLQKRIDPVDRNEWDFSELTPITIHFDGSIEPRDTSDSDDYTMELFFARPGDIVVSKIDLKNGAVGIVPNNLTNVVVTNHFVVYEPNPNILYPPYLMRIIQSSFFKDYLWRKKVGSEGRKEVKIDLFESTLLPLPEPDVQARLVHSWEQMEDERTSLMNRP